MVNLRYDLWQAGVEFGVKMHPQLDMARLGYKIIKSEPVPLADCWWFRVEEDIASRPGYIDELGVDFRFSDER